MTIYKVSERILERVQSADRAFAGIIFDCDGVLINATRSYDLTVELCAKAFGASLGRTPSDDNQLYQVLELLRNLGTFNNDWDSVAVIVAYLFKKSNNDGRGIDIAAPLANRLKILESNYLHSLLSESKEKLGFDELIEFLGSCPAGKTREEIIQSLIPEKESRDRFSAFVSYPAPVGEGLLATFFDEAMYGKVVFKKTYGLECVTTNFSVPGNIQNESVIVAAQTLTELQQLCNGNLGIITGRPKIPTVYTLGRLFEFFRRQEICVFTGENLLDKEEVKPSPRPMLRVADALQDKLSSILYVGDSEEDLMMVERANELRDQKVLFVAIAPTRERAEFFEKRGNEHVECIISDINDLPKALLGERLWAEAS